MSKNNRREGSIASQKITAAEASEQELLNKLQEKIRQREEQGLKKLTKFLEDEGLELVIAPNIVINGQSPAIMVKAKQA